MANVGLTGKNTGKIRFSVKNAKRQAGRGSSGRAFDRRAGSRGAQHLGSCSRAGVGRPWGEGESPLSSRAEGARHAAPSPAALLRTPPKWLRQRLSAGLSTHALFFSYLPLSFSQATSAPEEKQPSRMQVSDRRADSRFRYDGY